jgi:hypothetical protein
MSPKNGRYVNLTRLRSIIGLVKVLEAGKISALGIKLLFVSDFRGWVKKQSVRPPPTAFAAWRRGSSGFWMT